MGTACKLVASSRRRWLLAMEGANLFPTKSDAQVEAELAQTTRQIEMLRTTSRSGATPGGGAASGSAGGAPAASRGRPAAVVRTRKAAANEFPRMPNRHQQRAIHQEPCAGVY